MSLPKRFYEFLLLLGLVAMIYLYAVAFDDFSETELVQLSYGWLALVVFGAHGLIASEIESLQEAGGLTYAEARRARGQQPNRSPFSYMATFFMLSFEIVRKLFGARSPLVLAATATVLWLGALFLFLEGIFPAL